jgi:carbon storage regulator
MLVLTRKPGETVLIGDDVEITIVKTTGSRVRLSINAPREISVRRGELPVEADPINYRDAIPATAAGQPESALLAGRS